MMPTPPSPPPSTASAYSPSSHTSQASTSSPYELDHPQDFATNTHGTILSFPTTLTNIRRGILLPNQTTRSPRQDLLRSLQEDQIRDQDCNQHRARALLRRHRARVLRIDGRILRAEIAHARSKGCVAFVDIDPEFVCAGGICWCEG